MISRIIEVARWALYGLIIYNTFSISWWVSLGFLVTFLHLELSVLAIAFLRRDTKNLQVANEASKKSFSPLDADFGFEFSSEPLTDEEKEYIKQGQSGDIKGVENFLHSRCLNKTIDFTEVPIAVKLLMTAKVMSILDISTKPEAEWADVIEDKSDNN